MDWKEFEVIVRWVYGKMGAEFGVEIVGYGPSNWHKGKSGVLHQVDVLTSHSDGLHSYLTAIECKWWNEKVSKDIVMKVDSVKADCNFDKAVIVCKLGFTEDAIKYAASRNLQLVELREYNLQIADDVLTKVYMHFKISQPELVDVKLRSDGKTIEKYSGHAILSSDDCYFLTPQKEKLAVHQLINEFLNKEVLVSPHHELMMKERNFEKGTKLKSPSISGSIPIEAVQFTGYNRMYTKLDAEYFHLKVWLALKLIFENKQYAVTVAGDIEPLDNGEPLQLIQGRTARMEAIGNARQFKINKNFNLLELPSGPAGQIPV